MIGAVSSRSARIFYRNPNQTHPNVAVKYRTSPTEPWKYTEPISVNESTDFTATAILSDLLPNTEYEYALYFEDDTKVNSFKTFPLDGTPTQTRFAFGSCILKPFWKSSLNGWKYIEDSKPDFVLFIGDFIYYDFPLNLGSKKEYYEAKYRKVFAEPNLRSLASKVPFFMMYDDHEIVNDFDAGPQDVRYKTAIDVVWKNYIGNHNPDPFHQGSYYYQYQIGNIGYFVLDTRQNRDANDKEVLFFIIRLVTHFLG